MDGNNKSAPASSNTCPFKGPVLTAMVKIPALCPASTPNGAFSTTTASSALIPPFFKAINIVFQRELGREATQEEIESIYQEKSVLFNSYPEAKPMPGAWELLQKVKKDGLIPMVVTGSGQLSLLERLEHHYPGMFHKELMVTAFDVKYGKPIPSRI